MQPGYYVASHVSKQAVMGRELASRMTQTTLSNGAMVLSHAGRLLRACWPRYSPPSSSSSPLPSLIATGKSLKATPALSSVMPSVLRYISLSQLACTIASNGYTVFLSLLPSPTFHIQTYLNPTPHSPPFPYSSCSVDISNNTSSIYCSGHLFTDCPYTTTSTFFAPVAISNSCSRTTTSLVPSMPLPARQALEARKATEKEDVVEHCRTQNVIRNAATEVAVKVNQKQSLNIVQTSVAAALSTILFIKDVFPPDYYEHRSYNFRNADFSYSVTPADAMSVKKQNADENTVSWHMLLKGKHKHVDKMLYWLVSLYWLI